jgi:hypothetical protein
MLAAEVGDRNQKGIWGIREGNAGRRGRTDRRKERKNIVAVVFRRKMNRGVHFDTMIIDALIHLPLLYICSKVHGPSPAKDGTQAQ